ncbi:MAG: metallophosphoesterase family protein [Xanthomonadales bacterium]|nr:metallophosphoesterase family protein [Xanthomonadales bacterium]
MNRKTVAIAAFVLLAGFILARAIYYSIEVGHKQKIPAAETFVLPELSDTDFDWIGSRIYQNEALGKAEFLVHWNEGEDFPSLGIGHFIWFPEGVDAPFDEQFPALVSYLREQVPGELKMPDWLGELEPFAAPWKSKVEFESAATSSQVNSLRTWLEATKLYQARFIVSAFEQRWRELDLPVEKKQKLTGLLQLLFETPEGLFAVIDYYNFKGLGNNPRESYKEQGWGLVQVLDELTGLRSVEDECADIVAQFKDAAASRLHLRVDLSPPERNEARWLPGWMKRLDGYLESDAGKTRLGHCGFHVTPYVQNPAEDAITIIWFSKEDRAGRLTVWERDAGSLGQGVMFESTPVRAEALAYHEAEICGDFDCVESPLPYLHQIRLKDLEPDTLYQYQVTQNTDHRDGHFSTLDKGDKSLRFIVYGDSETEPESTGKHTHWPSVETPARPRRYPLDQTTGYARNLKVIQQRQPAFVAIAGDLVQSGGEQRDWDEFWIHNADLAASTVLLPSLGNHDYFGGPGEFGKYTTPDSERAVHKYQTYFDLPSNGADDINHSERYYSLKHGAVTIIVLDVINGLPDRSDMDTNWRLLGEGEGGFAPDWQPGSEQYRWLQAELQMAQENSHFTFVMFHHSPYTSGLHGRLPGEKPRGDILSAQPLQSLTPLFIRHGVDAVFGGHDEMYEHSVLPGTEVSPDGLERDHSIHFYDIGIGGDGLRGPVKGVENPYRVFLAHTDAPEVYGPDGVLRNGGKHYGHLEVNVEQNSDGSWQARIDPVYIFPVLQTDGQVIDFERRIYADPLTLTAH